MPRSPASSLPPARNRAQALPLSLRLPNPPAPFVGRAQEIRWLRTAVERAPITILSGAGGLGKSALALFTLHARFPARAAETLYLSFRDVDPHEPAALGVVRALVSAGGLRSFDWAEVLRAPDALGALAVELAEAQGRWLVLDDMQHGEAAQVGALLRHAARYGRDSRWILTTREAPAEGALLGQVLHLGPMSDLDLTRLTRALDPAAPRTDVKAAVARAQGSPFRLRATHAAPAPDAPPLAGLPDAARDVLLALRMLATPLPENDIGRIVDLPPGSVDALLRRGLLERGSLGLRLHELVHHVLPPPDARESRSLAARAASVLAQSGEAPMALAALRLLLDAGAADEAAALLQASAERLLRGGYAPALWHLLENALDPRLEHARLRCAVALGDGAALSRTGPPVNPTLESRFLWAQILLAKGQLAEAGLVAEGVRASAAEAGRADLAFDAGLLAARATLNDRGAAEGLALLEALEPVDTLSTAQRDAHVSFVLANQGEGEAAAERAARVLRLLPDLPWPERGRVGAFVASTLLRVGRLREATTMFDRALAEDQQGSARFDVGRAIRFHRVVALREAGDLERARAEIARLSPYVGPGSLLHHYLEHGRIVLAIDAGEFEGIDERIAALDAVIPSQLRRDALPDRARLALLRREPFRAPADLDAAGPSIFGESCRLWQLEIDLRRGDRAPADALAGLELRVDNLELRIQRHRVRAVAHLVAGAPGLALSELDEAIALARERGFRGIEAELLEIACDALLVLDRGAPLAAAIHALGALGGSMPAARFVCSARFLQAVTAPALDLAAVEASAGAWTTAPHVALRAQALLGAPGRLDVVDRQVLSAVERRPGRVRVEILGGAAGGAWQPGWGLDEAALSVWLPGGERVDFSRQPVLWSMLRELAALGGRATKEQLVLRVWKERAYHPLRHDNRLQAAVRKLRRRIEDDPSAPSRILTHEEGYALGGILRVARPAPGTVS